MIIWKLFERLKKFNKKTQVKKIPASSPRLMCAKTNAKSAENIKNIMRNRNIAGFIFDPNKRIVDSGSIK